MEIIEKYAISDLNRLEAPNRNMDSSPINIKNHSKD
jgi:hypothetical protein